MNTVGRIQDQTLKQFVQTHGASQETAGALRDASLDVVDYVKGALAGDKACDHRTAFRLMDELRDGLYAAKQTPIAQFKSNCEAASAEIDRLNEGGGGKLNGKTVTLEPAREEHSDGRLIKPSGLDVRTSGSESYRGDDGAMYHEKVLDATLHVGAEKVGPSARIASNYAKLGDDYSSRPTRPGLDSTLAELDKLTPLVQALLADRAMRNDEMGHFHQSEHDSSTVQSSQGADVEATRKLFGRGNVEGSESSSLTAISTHDSSAAGSFQPALVDALAGLQSLRAHLQNISAYPSKSMNLEAGRSLTEDVRIETTEVPAGTFWHRHPAPQVSTSTEKAQLGYPGGYYDTSRSTTRPLGSVPYVPAYLDVPPES